ncbi:MAG: hypothetical protein IKR40_00015 [Treponema sp.]|nr:hypothetical protein [Treponema sp.]
MEEKSFSDLEKVRKEERVKSACVSALGCEITSRMREICELISLAEKSSGLDDDLKICLGRLSSNAGHLLELSSDMVDFQRPSLGLVACNENYAPGFLVQGILDWSFESARKKNVGLFFENDESLPSVLRGDGTNLRRCIRNLLGAAVFHAERGDVRLRLGYESCGEEKIILSVRLTGTGAWDGNPEETDLRVGFASKILSLLGTGLEVKKSGDSEFELVFCLLQDVVDWSSVGKIEAAYEGDFSAKDEPWRFVEKISVTEGLDVDSAIRNCGNILLLESTMKKFRSSIDCVAKELQDYFDACDWKSYGMKVHSLKSTSRLIGAMSLSERAGELEKEADKCDVTEIKRNHPAFMKNFLSLKQSLSFLEKKDLALKPGMSEEDFEKELSEIAALAENFDLTALDERMARLSGFSVPPSKKELFEKIRLCVEEVDFPGLKKILAERT